jgi:hypothetical protein
LLAPGDITAGAVGANMNGCACGCMGCVSVCDGKGPVFALDAPPVPSVVPPLLVIQGLNTSLLPPSGRLGVYIRARGTQTLELAVIVPDGGPFSTTILTTPDDPTAFAPTVFSGDAVPGWSNGAGEPMAIGIGSGQMMAGVTRSVVEVDCIVPFVVSAP